MMNPIQRVAIGLLVLALSPAVFAAKTRAETQSAKTRANSAGTPAPAAKVSARSTARSTARSAAARAAARLAAAKPVAPSAYLGHPKLLVLIVIDQFRGDYLERYRSELKGHGFRLFLDQGAYFPNCYYNYANTVTAAGHSTLSTGTYTDGHGIAANEWWDLARSSTHKVTSVEDDRYTLVGTPDKQRHTGASPLNLRASTFGDEIRLATQSLPEQSRSRLFGISLKDRAAILTSGHASDGAFWIDRVSGQFVTSTYYMPQLPAWAVEFNQSGRPAQAILDAGVSTEKKFYDSVGQTPAANAYELDFARALIEGESLGQHAATDVLTISLSANDILGHAVGPDDPAMHQMALRLDSSLDQFFSWLDETVPGGLNNVWLALSADHGVAPIPAEAGKLHMPAASLDMAAFSAAINDTINQKFSPGEKVVYILPDQSLPYLQLNRPTFEKAGINETEAEQAVQQAIPAALATVLGNAPAPAAKDSPNAEQAPKDASAAPPSELPGSSPQGTHPQILASYTRLQLSSEAPGLPPSEFGQLLAHSYSPNGGWYVLIVPAAYQMETLHDIQTTHFSPYAYDRHVPLAFYGAPFIPGTYREHVEPVDLAPTLTTLLGVNQPSSATGHVLTQALRPPPPAVQEVKPRPRARSGPAPASSATDAAAPTPVQSAPIESATPAPQPQTQSRPAPVPQP